MTNFVRACFCIDKTLDKLALQNIQDLLANNNCRDFGRPIWNLDVWIGLDFYWAVLDKYWKSRIIQISSYESNSAMFSFDIDILAFLPNVKTRYMPDDDEFFSSYKNLVSKIIKYIQPYIGIVGIEADLLCQDLEGNSFDNWGVFLSDYFLSALDKEERKSIAFLADEELELENVGLLMFNHPLDYEGVSKKSLLLSEKIKFLLSK